ncbi:MAG: tRNA (guanosine(46)-N7)-methyltransferase TrmB [Bacilli bacterium]|nr:tRNA (guanosine(46)-N7)-methyltransferase TrmB [Bacilli bacterium]
MRIRNLKNTDEIVNNSKYLIKNPKDYKGNYKKIFNNNNPIHLEIGMGKGDFIINMALVNPKINFIGIELHTNVIARACKKLENLELPNLRLINVNALELNDVFDKEIDLIYLNFSDPWPKKRNSNRRLTSEIFLNIYEKLFRDKKIIRLKTDNTLLFEYSIISLTNYGYKIDEISLDLDNSDIENIETEYETKFKSKGIKINYLKAIK